MSEDKDILRIRINMLEKHNSILEFENKHLTESIKQLREELDKEKNGKVTIKDVINVALIGVLAILLIFTLDFLAKL